MESWSDTQDASQRRVNVSQNIYPKSDFIWPVYVQNQQKIEFDWTKTCQNFKLFNGQVSAVTDMVPYIFGAPDFFGPQEIWSFTVQLLRMQPNLQ